MARYPRFLFPLAVLVPLALTFAPLGCSSSQDAEPQTPPSDDGDDGGIPPADGGDEVDGGDGGEEPRCPAKAAQPLLDGDCDPLVPTQCGFPFPSNVYLADDATSVTCKRVAFGKTTLPKRTNGKYVNPATWDDSDGFSPGQAPMTDLPGATTAGLPTQHDIDLSLSTDSPTILLDAETGERIPHFAELDMSQAATDADRTFMLRPVVRLKDRTRYIVAIRRVKDVNGLPLAPSPAFKALRDGEASQEPSVERRRALYDDIFKKLADAGIDKSDLQIAWDYTTASRENNTRALVAMRDDALAKVGEEGPEYSIVSTEENPNEFIRRRILAKMKVPLYLDKPEAGGRLVLGEDGLPKQNGWAEYEVLIHIPNSAVGTPLPLLQNGHGLLGRKTEGQNGYLAKIADMNRFVAFSVDLVGMAADDEEVVTNAVLGDIGNFRAAVDRQHQGILNSLLAMRMMKGRFVNEELATFDGVSAINPSECYYRGDSQGGIFGTTYMALSTDVTRGLLGEPGMPYNLLLNRSVDFDPFFSGMQLAYGKSSKSIQLALGLVQMLWDRTEPNGYAPYIAQNTLPGTPSHDVLIHVAIGDYQVTPLGAHILARTVGAKNVSPVNRSIWGISEASGMFAGSGIVEFDFGLPPVPDTNVPPKGELFPEDSDPHDEVRKLDAARNQTEEFLRAGKINHYCDGPCDPE